MMLMNLGFWSLIISSGTAQAQRGMNSVASVLCPTNGMFTLSYVPFITRGASTCPFISGMNSISNNRDVMKSTVFVAAGAGLSELGRHLSGSVVRLHRTSTIFEHDRSQLGLMHHTSLLTAGHEDCCRRCTPRAEAGRSGGRPEM